MSIFWLGNTESLDILEHKLGCIPAKSTLKSSFTGLSLLDIMAMEEDDEEGNPVELTITDNVAVGRIEGPLIPKASNISRWLGIVSYEDIAEFLSNMGERNEITKVVLSYHSGGGAATGCFDCGKFVNMFSDKVKPVISYVDSEAGSAAMLLATSSGQVVMGKGSGIGSLGVIMKHTEESKRRKAMGLTDTIFRTSPKKALINSIEPLSDEAVKQIEKEIGEIHEEFVGEVSNYRDMSPKAVQSDIATGEMFSAEDAILIGLADRVLPFQELMDKLLNANTRQRGQ